MHLTDQELQCLARLRLPSTEHLTHQERVDGTRQMIADLHRIADSDGCIAAAWALELIKKNAAACVRISGRESQRNLSNGNCLVEPFPTDRRNCAPSPMSEELDEFPWERRERERREGNSVNHSSDNEVQR